MATPRSPESLWYKDAVIYELHVRSFCDGNGDGIGDFPGLLSKLDYLEKLGVTAIWLLPFYPSPLRDDGYDTADYTNVHPDYGTLADFRRFLKAAHDRGLQVITELVLNHTSDQHAWFQRARAAKPGSNWRKFYVWSDTPEKYGDARIIFQDFEVSNWTWDPVAKAYFWHRFYSHQPDLNFDHPPVRKALLKVVDFWFGLGVDGLRLDAVPYLYEREGTNCENLPETYAFLRELRAHVDQHHPNRLLLAEANQWPEDAVAYFGDGDMCHMAFHFPLMPRMYMALEMENRYPVVDILEQTPTIPESCQWALFLRNHDELTLEMVTDEERDYMYRLYVGDPRARINLGIRRRLAPLLGNDRRKIELMNLLLMTLPGTPVIYYGDEIGMGDNFMLGDRNGVRTPMQWTMDRNGGFSLANPQQLFLPVISDPEYAHGTLNVENQDHYHASLLWWMRRLITVRRLNPCLGRGSIEFLSPDNGRVLAFVRHCNGEAVLVAVNLSRHLQQAELDLSAFAGRVPEDIFSLNSLRPVGADPYPLTFPPYGGYVLTLKQPTAVAEPQEELPLLRAEGWPALIDAKAVRTTLEKRILPRYLQQQRWYGGKARKILATRILEGIPFPRLKHLPLLVLLQVDYQEGEPEVYILPLACAPLADPAAELPPGSLARVELKGSPAVIYEAVFDPPFHQALLGMVVGQRRQKSPGGWLVGRASRTFRRAGVRPEEMNSRLLGREQSNTTILYGQELLLKLYRRTEQGPHPDVEITRYLTERAGFEHTPPYLGHLEFVREGGQPIVLGLLQGFVPNQGDAWEQALGLVGSFFERVLDAPEMNDRPPAMPAGLLAASQEEPPAPLADLLAGEAREMARQLGARTADMHLALAGSREEAFRPEAFSSQYQRALFQAMRNLALAELRLLRRNLGRLPEDVHQEAEAVLALEPVILQQLGRITGARLQAQKIRIHGDYHLGQVLFTGRDYVLFDFEGEPARPLSERRIKRSPIRDVAGMIRSLQYAAYSGLLTGGPLREADVVLLQPWADLWYQQMSGWFLHSYRERMDDSPLLPTSDDAFAALLVPYLLEKALYEASYELNNRPDWLLIPLRGIRFLCGD